MAQTSQKQKEHKLLEYAVDNLEKNNKMLKLNSSSKGNLEATLRGGEMGLQGRGGEVAGVGGALPQARRRALMRVTGPVRSSESGQ